LATFGTSGVFGCNDAPGWDFSSPSLWEEEKSAPSSIFACFDISVSATVVSSDAGETSNSNATDDSFIGAAANVAKAEFIECFRRGDNTLPTSIATLADLLKQFPELVFVVRKADNELELHCQRESLVEALCANKDMFPHLVFASFERGLKHAGMEVTQSTHGQEKVKKWAIKKDPREASKYARNGEKRKGEWEVVESRSKRLK
jgi:hypothetical protein